MIWDGREVGSQQSIVVIMRGRWKHARMPKFHFECNAMHWLAIFIRASQSLSFHSLPSFSSFIIAYVTHIYTAERVCVCVLLNIFVYANE